MNFVVKILLSSIAVVVASYLLTGVDVDGFMVAVFLAVVLSLLNITIKPLLIIFTIPLTVLTLGLFLLVIHAVIVLIAGKLVPGFTVDGFWWALIFSLVLSVTHSLMTGLSKSGQK